MKECLNTRAQELCDAMLCKAITAVEDSVRSRESEGELNSSLTLIFVCLRALASLSPSSPPLPFFLPLSTHYSPSPPPQTFLQHPALMSSLFGDIFTHSKTCLRNKNLRYRVCVCVCMCAWACACARAGAQHKISIVPMQRGSNDEQPFDYLNSLIIKPCLST